MTIISNEDTQDLQTDPRLLILMQWLKDNDENGEQVREHANRHYNKMAPEIISGTDYD